MRERSDPLVPVLGAVVSLVVLGAVVFVFYPRVRMWIEADGARVARPATAAAEPVSVWICRSSPGVAMILEADFPVGDAARLGQALEGGPHRFLRLRVYNFAQEEPFALALPAGGFVSPEGGAAAVPAARLLKDAPADVRTLLVALGAVDTVAVAKGRSGQALLVLPDDPGARTAFVSGGLRFERKEIERGRLSSWRARPDLAQFLEF